jgi:glycosyltransferase involved in cell wall biosynthesis
VRDAYAKFARIPLSKIAVTYESGDVPNVTPEPISELKDTQFLLYVGQQSDYKNIRRLMQAHQQLLENHPHLQLVLVGPLTGLNGPPLVANKTWAEKQGFKNIRFTGFVSNEQLVWLYQHCATYTFPSLMEGFGLPPMEAMMAGAVVTSSNASCLPEVYEDAVHYFDPLDIDDMAAKINDVLTSEKLRTQLLARSKQLTKKYSWKKTAEETLAVYKEVLEQ